MVTDRRGATLVELLATLPLLALVAIVSVLLVLDGQRVSRTVEGRTMRTRELRHAAAAISSELRSTRARDLFAWNDTLIEFDATVGFGFVCGSNNADRIDLLPASGSDPLRSTWSSAPDAGDRIEISTHAGAHSDMPDTHQATISFVGSSTTACAASTLRQAIAGSVTRLDVSPSLPSPAVIGAPARMVRRTRLSLYRTSDNEWYVGLRTLRPTGWETTQPVAGPFTSAADRGLRFTIRARNGTALAPRTIAMPIDTTIDNAPTSVDLLLRASSKWKDRHGTRATDSLISTIALRNR